MSKFFMKKKVIIFIVGAIVAVMIGILVGTNIVNTIKNKEQLAEKAKVAKSIEEKKEIEEKIKKAEEDNPSEEEYYSEEYKEYEKKSEDEKAEEEVIPRKEKVDYKELEKIREDQKEDLGKEYVLEEDKENDEESVLPRYFNLKDKISIPVRDQGSYGLCWDFASVKSVETNLALTKEEYYDISESHIDYMTSDLMKLYGRSENCGGNFSDLKSYNELFKGFVLEEEVPLNIYEEYEYNTFYNTPKEDLVITKYAEFPTVYNYGDMSDEEYNTKMKELQTAIKTHIMNYGSVYAVINAPDYGKNHYVKSYSDVEDGRGNHAISIVGWDDNYSRDNFTSPGGNKPEKDGAYIALNSWGDDWGDNGYFYISYEDYNVHGQMSGVVSINNKEDLLKLSSLSKNVQEYIMEKYSDKIIDIDGEMYVKDENFGTAIDLSNRNIKDISEYEILFRRAYSIDLSNNSIESIEGLEKYTPTENVSINLSNNNIKDVSCLKDIKINSLILDGNKGVKGYDEISISFKLSLANCDLESFEVNDNIKEIGSLDLSGNRIEDYSSLTKLSSLYYLVLDDCGFTSLDAIKDVISMESLDYLRLAHNNLKDISGLENTDLYSIDLSYNTEIEDYEPLRKIKYVGDVSVVGCDIKDAKDILVESISEEQLKESHEIADESDFGEVSIGVSYDISENRNISNLKALKNASRIKACDCNLGDISELREVKYLEEIDLSHNHNLSGDLSGLNIGELYVIDCNLDNNFDAFNIDSVGALHISENNIDNYDKFIDKVQWEIFDNSIDEEKSTENGVYISREYVGVEPIEKVIEIEIPDEDGLKLNLAKYLNKKKLNSKAIKVNGILVKSSELISVNENTKITFNSYSDLNITIVFKVNKDMKSSEIEVLYNPYQGSLKTSKSIDPKLIRVAKVYSDCVYKEIDQFEISDEVYKLPSKVVKRDYKQAGIGYIYVAEKYFAQVKHDGYEAKFTVGLTEGKNVIEIKDTSDNNENDIDENKDDKDKEGTVLTFSSKQLYEIAKKYWEGLYEKAYDDLLIIELKELREENDSGLPMYIPRDLLYDVQGLKPIIVTDIYILMDMENGLDRIEEEDLKVLENFENLKNIHIITPPEEYNEIDLIIPQDKYVVTIENGVG